MTNLQEMVRKAQGIKIGINLSDPYSPVINAKAEAEDFALMMEQYGKVMDGITEISQSIIRDYNRTLN